MDTGSETTVAIPGESETPSKDEEAVQSVDPAGEDHGTIEGEGPTGDAEHINSASEEDDVKSSSEKLDMSETVSSTDENLGKVERTELTEVNSKDSPEENSLETERDSNGCSDEGDRPSVTTNEATTRSDAVPVSSATDVLERAGVLLKRERREGDDFVEGDIASLPTTTATVASSSSISVAVDSVTGTGTTNGTNERHVRFADDLDKIPENGEASSTEQQTQQQPQVTIIANVVPDIDFILLGFLFCLECSLTYLTYLIE